MRNHRTISLIPYLSPRSGGFGLDIDRRRQAVPEGGEASYSFEVISDADPFGRLMGARLVSDTGCEIKKLFLLVQKDAGQQRSDELRPVTNPDVDRCWRHAGKQFSADPRGPCLTLGPPQDPSMAWRSLFYCHRQQAYFHPPCPVCGHALALCRDDAVLTDSGLPPYSESLERYLYCPLCHDVAGQSDFFSYDRKPSDPAMVKDRWRLIRDLGQVPAEPAGPLQFPCSGCPDRETCYGADDLAVTRIEILGFYPFYMLIFPAASLPAMDFQALVSGASARQIKDRLGRIPQKGRIQCLQAAGVLEKDAPLFLFRQTPRFVLEVLYLKLNFLLGLVDRMPPASAGCCDPEAGMSLDRFWVQLTDQAGLLPQLWNFTVQRIGLGNGDAASGRLPRHSPADREYGLGIIWFHTLLVNSRQSSAKVLETLQHLLEISNDSPESDSGDAEKMLADPVFAPQNILWNADGAPLPPGIETVWQETLAAGWHLLRSCRGDLRDPGIERAAEKLVHWLAAVKKMLFAPGHDADAALSDPATDGTADADDLAILAILEKIGDSWSAGPADPAPAAEGHRTDVRAESMATIGKDPEGSVTAGGPESATPAEGSPENRSGFTVKTTGPDDAEPICETVILSAEQFENREAVQTESAEAPDKIRTDLQQSDTPGGFSGERTVIQKAPDASATPHLPVDGNFPDHTGNPPVEELEETLVLSPADRKKGLAAPKEDLAATMIQSPAADTPEKTAAPGKPGGSTGDELEKTLVARPKGAGTRAPAAEDPPAGDELAETVILRPKGKNRT